MFVNFVKMHGLGNDFIFIKKIDLPNCNRKFITNICTRNTGIGADQLIFYEKLPSSYRMEIYNSDGSDAVICGNATRCLAKLIHQKTGETSFTINSMNKQLKCNVDNDSITVDIGPAEFTAPPQFSKEKLFSAILPYATSLNDVIYVNTGNEHIILYGDFTETNKQKVGAMLQSKEFFEDGINVSFANVYNNTINLIVWERGVGLTLACGSGACATFAASLKLGLVISPVDIVFKIGKLTLANEKQNILMIGPATLISEGKYYY